MTSIDAMTALLHDDLAAAMIMRATSNNNDYATFRINYDIMRIANRELTDALACDANDTTYRYYYSDSTHDEIRNPATIIDECRALFDADYDDDPDLTTFAATIAENIDYLTSYNLTEYDDAAREFATIDDLAAFIADLAHKTS